MKIDLSKIIDGFLRLCENDICFELYNEAGLQHELALYLRQKLPKGYRVQLERSIYDVIENPNKQKMEKILRRLPSFYS